MQPHRRDHLEEVLYRDGWPIRQAHGPTVLERVVAATGLGILLAWGARLGTLAAVVVGLAVVLRGVRLGASVARRADERRRREPVATPAPSSAGIVTFYAGFGGLLVATLAWPLAAALFGGALASEGGARRVLGLSSTACAAAAILGAPTGLLALALVSAVVATTRT